MELRHLRYFATVAEELHFRKAAERLFIAQPGLSRQIRQLEQELGLELFVRHNRKVELTAAGRYFQQRVNEILRDLEGAIVNVKLIADGLRGELRVGYIGSAMQRAIPDLMLSVNRDYPDIRFVLREMDNPQQLEALLQGEIDLGFVRMERVPPPLATKTLLEDTFSLVLPEQHPVTSENFKDLKQLKEEPFILFEPSYSESYYQNVMRLFDAAGFSPKLSHSTVNASSIYRLVSAGFGLSIVPSVLSERYDMRVKFIELTASAERTSLRMVWNEERKNPLLEKIGVG